MTPELSNALLALAFTFAVIALYMLPTILGWNKRNSTAILALNVLLGWTLVGWVIALVWALCVDREDRN